MKNYIKHTHQALSGNYIKEHKQLYKTNISGTIRNYIKQINTIRNYIKHTDQELYKPYKLYTIRNYILSEIM